MLWADDLAAIWPASLPRARSSNEEQSLRELLELEHAGLFSPKNLASRPIDLSKTLEELRWIGADAPIDAAWEDGAPAVGQTRPAEFIAGEEGSDDIDRFMYLEKLGPENVAELKRRGLLTPHPDGLGYVVWSAQVLDRLLAAAACMLHDVSHGRLVPYVETPVQARRLAAPSAPVDTRHAIVVELPGVVTPNLTVDLRRFIDFRLDEANDQARRDYIDTLTEVWCLCSDGGAEHAFHEVVRTVENDLRKASKTYLDRVSRRDLAALGLGAMSWLIPLASTHPPAVVAAAFCSAGALATTVVVRKGAPRYVRSAEIAGLLATTAEL